MRRQRLWRIEISKVAGTRNAEALRCRRRDRPSAPFRCLDPQYRRELARVYTTNVEGICRRFVEERRAKLQASWGDEC